MDMRTVNGCLLAVIVSLFAGCASTWPGTDFAVELKPAALGRTAIVVHRPTYDDAPVVSDERIRATAAVVLQTLAGASEGWLSSPTQGKSDYELVMAAREAKVDTVCVLTVENIGQMFRVAGAIPPIDYHSDAIYNFRLLDVQTGKLLLETQQHETTWFPGADKDNALHDLERGMSRTLLARGYLPVSASPSKQTASAK
jgi:hypothetical protein